MDTDCTFFVRSGARAFAKKCSMSLKREDLIDAVLKKWDGFKREEIFMSYDLQGSGELDLEDEEDMENMLRLVQASGISRVSVFVRKVGDMAKTKIDTGLGSVGLGKSKGEKGKGKLDSVSGSSEEEGSEIPYVLEKDTEFLDGAVVNNQYVSDQWKNLMVGPGQRFYGGAVQFRSDLIKYSVVMGFEYVFKKNRPQKIVAMCKFREDLGCKWEIRAVLDLGSGAMCISLFDRIHTCESNYSKVSRRRFDNRMVCEIIVDDIKNMPTLNPAQVQALVRKNYGLEISYAVAWKAIERARNIVFGDQTSSFGKLPAYFDELQVANPGSYVDLEVDENNKFVRCFFAFKACLEGFNYCRPILMVDGTFLKVKHKGCLLSAVGKDGDEGLFPLAFAVVNEETDANWLYFFTHLKQAVGVGRKIVFVSDRNHGILKGISTVFPGWYHTYCYNHLKANLEYRCKGMGKKVRGIVLKMFQKAAYATTPEMFEYYVAKMVKVGKDNVQHFLEDTPRQMWANAFFEGKRYGQLTSNGSESWNSQIRLERTLPITSLIDGIRSKLMQQFSRRRQRGIAWQTILCKSVDEDVNQKVEMSRGWDVRKCSDEIWEVLANPACIVDLKKQTCTCKMWELKGMLCVHAVRIVFLVYGGRYEYVDPFFMTEFYQATYAGEIVPFCMPDLSVQRALVRAPDFHQTRGRPKRKRIPSQGEIIPKKIKCGLCGMLSNHNKKTCRNKRVEE